jgi:hypothetical protein
MGGIRRTTVLGLALLVAVAVVLAGVVLADEGVSDGAPPAQPGRKAATQPPRDRDDRHRNPHTGVRIPRLIGMSPGEIRHEIKGLGVPVKFETELAPCGPPVGRVVLQVPHPGGLLHFNEVRVWTDHHGYCNARPIARMCGPADLTLDSFARESSSVDASARTVGFTVKNATARSCQLQTTALAVLEGLNGSPGNIRGNPATVEFDYRLAPGKGVSVYLEWSNWCRDAARWRFRGGLPGLMAQTSVRTPGCVEETRKSRRSTLA